MIHPIHYAAWEHKFEELGPFHEKVTLEHRCQPSPAKIPVPDDCPCEPSGMARVWNVVKEHGLLGLTHVLDIGGGDRSTAFPNAEIWDSKNGDDARHLDGEMYLDPFELIISNHLIEHVDSIYVPTMLASWIPAIKPNGFLFISAPHRCSEDWSVLLSEEVGKIHKWAPTMSCVANLLFLCGMEMLDFSSHRCKENDWWLLMRKL